MQTHHWLLVVLAFGFNFSPIAFAQKSTDQKFIRLKYRYQINDIDGIGELITPLWQQTISGEPEFDLVQQHLIAIAAVKYYVRTGEHQRAILPYLVGVQMQETMKKESLETLLEPLDASFGIKYLPPIFYSEQDQRQFQSELDTAIDQGLLNQSEFAAKYREANPGQLDRVQSEMLTSITAAKTVATPSDREILRLIESFVAHKDQHWTLAHESLATAIEALERLNRNDEAARLAAAFRNQFPDSRRLER